MEHVGPESVERQQPGVPELTGEDVDPLLERWSDREEVESLPEILRPAEGLVAVGSGMVVRSGRLAHSKWLVVLTDRRLLCIKGRSESGRKVIDMPVSAIREVDSAGLLRKTLNLDTGYGKLRISGLHKDVAARMVDGINALLEAYDRGPETLPAVPAADLSTAGTGGGHTHEELQTLDGAVARLTDRVGELTDRVAFLEELVRSNVSPHAPEESETS